MSIKEIQRDLKQQQSQKNTNKRNKHLAFIWSMLPRLVEVSQIYGTERSRSPALYYSPGIRIAWEHLFSHALKIEFTNFEQTLHKQLQCLKTQTFQFYYSNCLDLYSNIYYKAKTCAIMPLN